jgi:hypothetical protein
MWLFVNWAILILATLMAGAAAVSIYWLFLRATLVLMRPAAVRPRQLQPVAIRSTDPHRR